MNFFRKFGDLIESLDKEPDDNAEISTPKNKHPTLQTDQVAATHEANYSSIDLKRLVVDTEYGSQSPSINLTSAYGELACTPDTKCMPIGMTSPSSVSPTSFTREGKSGSIDGSPDVPRNVEAIDVSSEIEDGTGDVCSDCVALQKKLAARQAACAARDSEAKRQVRHIETLEAALKAEKCRTRVAQGAVESAERRVIMLERELSHSRNENIDLKSRISLLELKLDLDCQESEELTSGMEQDASEHSSIEHELHGTKQAAMTVHLDQDQDEARSSAGGVAAAEISRLKASLRESQAMVEAVRAQQLRLMEGMDAELKLRDAELAMRDEELSSLRGFDTRSNEVFEPEVAPIREIAFVEAGPLGIEFEEMEAPFFVREVVSGTQAEGRLYSGDHIIDINGARADGMTWSELVASMKLRPVTVHVQHLSHRSRKPMLEKQAEALEKRVGAAWGTVCLLTGRAKDITTKAVTAAMTELKDFAKEDQKLANAGNLPIEV